MHWVEGHSVLHSICASPSTFAHLTLGSLRHLFICYIAPFMYLLPLSSQKRNETDSPTKTQKYILELHASQCPFSGIQGFSNIICNKPVFFSQCVRLQFYFIHQIQPGPWVSKTFSLWAITSAMVYKILFGILKVENFFLFMLLGYHYSVSS